MHHQLDRMIHTLIPLFQDYHRKSMFSPMAVTVDSHDELSGLTLTADEANQLSVSQAIEYFESMFIEQAKSNDLQATGIFDHSPGINLAAKTFAFPMDVH